MGSIPWIKCKIKLHPWQPIWTNYTFQEGYRIAWYQWCPKCKKERPNPYAFSR